MSQPRGPISQPRGPISQPRGPISQPREQPTNWAGNYSYRATGLLRPTSVAQVQELVAGARRIRALGSRHSFNDIADTDGVQVTLADIDPDVVVAADRRAITVGAGATYATLAAALAPHVLALANLASLPHITVGGAIATGTHGSGDANGGLGTSVRAIEFVTADGSLRTVSRGEDEFAAVVVSLGALGVATRITLDVEPAYEMRQDVYEHLPFDALIEHFDEITSAAYSVSLFTDWSGDEINSVWLKSRIGPDRVLPRTLFGAVPADGERHPVFEADPRNTTVQGGRPGPWSDRLPHFRAEYMPSTSAELQTEYLIPRSHALEALAAVRTLGPLFTPLLQTSEIRTVAADDLWLSPAYGTDAVGVHFTWFQDQPAVEEVLPVLEAALAPFGARPHWGKLFTADAAYLAAGYGRLGDFADVVARWDPSGKFTNAFLRSALGSDRFSGV